MIAAARPPVLTVEDRLTCPGCGYDLTGTPLGVCPECGRGFTEQDLARAAVARRTAWQELLDHLAASTWMWSAMIGGMVVVIGLQWAVGFDETLALTLALGLVGGTGLGLTRALRHRVMTVLDDPETAGRRPSVGMRWRVLGVTLPAFLIALPCVSFAVLAVVMVALGEVWGLVWG